MPECIRWPGVNKAVTMLALERFFLHFVAPLASCTASTCIAERFSLSSICSMPSAVEKGGPAAKHMLCRWRQGLFPAAAWTDTPASHWLALQLSM